VFRIAVLGEYTVCLGGGRLDRGPRAKRGENRVKSNTFV
jgi:hypothetical protein